MLFPVVLSGLIEFEIYKTLHAAFNVSLLQHKNVTLLGYPVSQLLCGKMGAYSFNNIYGYMLSIMTYFHRSLIKFYKLNKGK